MDLALKKILDALGRMNARSEPSTRLLGSAANDDWLSEPPNAPSRDELIALVKSFPYWYHRIYLGRGVYTLDTQAFHEAVWKRIKPGFPADLRGVSILDIGCNAGYFSLLAKLRGAGRVLGIESEERYFKQAETCRRIWNLDIEVILPKVG